MKILDDLLATLDMDTTVRDIRLGLFHTGVLTRHCGLASTLPHDSLKQKPHSTPLVTEPGFLLEKTVDELTHLAYSDSIPEAAIGMATINSLIAVDEQRCTVLNAGDLIAEKGRDKRVAIVGHFPFVPKLREIAKELWVIDPELAMRCVSQGATFRQVKGRRPLTMTK